MDKFRPLSLKAAETAGISEEDLAASLRSSLPADLSVLQKVLLVPPDATRAHSGAGKIANIYYHMLNSTCRVDVLPALGTHVPMNEEECAAMFGDIPYSCFIAHNWRTEVVNVGTVPREYLEHISEGIFRESVDIEINRNLIDPSYDLILSIGQVVPHEVIGMANYTKNILVGCGGSSLINASHILGAFYGMERIMGKDRSPVRKMFDYAEEHFLSKLPLCYVLTVTTAVKGDVEINGLFIGRERQLFEKAVALSQQKNITLIDEPLKKVVVYLDDKEFKSTWLGNKAIYRTRMAIADGGELIILAPGVERFGEDDDIDKLIRKYGYTGRENIMDICKDNEELQKNLSAAAHLIHGSSDGRFKITYCPGHLCEREVVDAGFAFMPYAQAQKRYDTNCLHDGFNTLKNGETVFYISNPALGLWACREKFK